MIYENSFEVVIARSQALRGSLRRSNPVLEPVKADKAWIATAKTPRDDDDEARLAAFLTQSSGVHSELSTRTYALTG
jgi:hypothetical protein